MCPCCGEIRPQRHEQATSVRLSRVRCTPATQSPRRGRGKFWKGACGCPPAGTSPGCVGPAAPGRRGGFPAPSSPPPRAVSAARVCAAGGSKRRTQWKFPLPAAATAATTTAAVERRKAGAGPEPPQGRGGSLPAARPSRLGAPLPGAGRPPFGPPGAGAAGQPPGGRLLARPRRRRRCLRRAGGGAAERAQLPAPFKPRRPPARSVCVQPGSRAGGIRRQHSRRPAFLLSFSVAPPTPCPAPPPPSSSLVPRQSPLLPPQPSSAMPRYELALILKAMQRPETAAVLKRTVEALMERGAIVRNLENLGERALPYKISKHNHRHRRGGYFLVDLEGPPSIVSTMMDHLGRDIDVIRRAFIKYPVPKMEECSGMVPVNYEDKLMPKKK
ncbi:small ribosomal subunit protein bS6m [Excalfactoria chinensis]|uniref:small ribosomal subunit protein bS6m n=1 Tax=Excalfactoria chinensis TaxID=46218 RepID=UPI003B3BB696